MKIGAVPGGYRGGEETWRMSKFWVGVEANSEPIGVVLAPSCVLLDRIMRLDMFATDALVRTESNSPVLASNRRTASKWNGWDRE